MNKPEDRKKIVIVLGAIIIVLLLALIFLEMKREQAVKQAQINEPVTTEDEPDSTTASRDWEETDFRKAVPVGVVVPEVGSQVSEEYKDVVAVPSHVVASAPGAETDIRIFQVRIENDRFIPPQIIVNLNDIVRVEFTSVDKDYDVILNGYEMMVKPKQGETKALEFKAMLDGRFVYYCEACGGLNSLSRGEIIIVRNENN